MSRSDRERYNRFQFPPLDQVGPEGLVAAGGNLSPEMLLSAYAQGIFPWYSEGQPILWWSPDPRFVLFPGELHLPRSLNRVLKRETFEIRCDSAFERVIEACRTVPRTWQDGTWITPEMLEAYRRLHEMGYAHSVEAYREGELVGGLYGVSLGAAFFGESMFADVTDASKVAFVTFVRRLQAAGFFLIDCQVYTEHLARFGAVNLPRTEFVRLLDRALEQPTWAGSWAGLFTDAPGINT